MAHASIGTALPQYGEVVSIKYRGTQVGGDYKTPRYASGRWVVSIKHRGTQVGFRIFFRITSTEIPNYPKFSVNTTKSEMPLPVHLSKFQMNKLLN